MVRSKYGLTFIMYIIKIVCNIRKDRKLMMVNYPSIKSQGKIITRVYEG